jgi:mono/diheme cytochrome c family protein
MLHTRWQSLVLFAAVSCAIPLLRAAEPVASPDAIRDGKSIFEAKHCVACHTATPLDQPGKRPLDKYKTFADPLLFGAVLWNHGPLMLQHADEAKRAQLDPWPQFEPGDVEKLVAYLHYASGAQQHQYLAGSDPEAGKALFEERCSACHSGKPDAIGPDLKQRLAANPSPSDIAGRMWNHIPAMNKAAVERKLTLPRLEAREMADIFAYLRGAARPPGASK